MGDERIQIYCRLLPTKEDILKYDIALEEDTEFEKIDFHKPKEQVNPFNPTMDIQETFRFNKIFDQDVEQIDVFEMVSKEILDHAINGYNGTIFAYGQTGTGKTHTIVGKDRYPDEKIDENSGIIPRSLEYLFSVLEDLEIDSTVLLSYMEIYRGNAYDLMSKVRKIKDDKDVASSFDELQKVVSRVGPKNKLVLANLKHTEVKSVNEALKAFVGGCRNRQMAETSINDASSRSHCVFTVHIQYRVKNRLLHSKINFVDLAGSERVGKHHDMSRKLLLEARTINLSLHHLQEVIVALGKSRHNRSNADRHFHVPFRNTMITNVLRESLGGNCKTSMIATVTPDFDNFNETISTCKFSQRVAKIPTFAKVNTDIDLRFVVAQLREENSKLLQQLNNPNQDSILHSNDPLSTEEKERLKILTSSYMQDEDESVDLQIDNDFRSIQYCFKLLKFGINFETKAINPAPHKAKGKTKTKKEEQKEEALKQKQLRNKEELKLENLKRQEIRPLEIQNDEIIKDDKIEANSKLENKEKQNKIGIKKHEKTDKAKDKTAKDTKDKDQPKSVKEDEVTSSPSALEEMVDLKTDNKNKKNKKAKDKPKTTKDQIKSTKVVQKNGVTTTPTVEKEDNSAKKNGDVPVASEPISKEGRLRLEKGEKKRKQQEKKAELAKQKELKKQNKKDK